MEETELSTSERVEKILTEGGLYTGDIVVIVAYFVGVIVVGITASRFSKRSSVDGYFLASRNMHWIPVGASLFASNIGSEHFIGLAGSGAASGIAISTYEMNAIFILMLLGWVFVPVYLASGIYTMPEYLRLRFGGQRIRTFLSVLTLLLYIFTKISADLYSGALYIKYALGLQGEAGLYISILVLLIISAVFTIGGGLSAVIWTDFVQTILMVIGAFIIMGYSLDKVGGYDGLVSQYAVANADPEYSSFKEVDGRNVSCMQIQDDFMHMLRSVDAPGDDLPWTGLFTGMLIGSIWYWCTDQVIVQRTLSAKDLTHAKSGVLLAGFLKFLPLFLLVLPGMAARVLYRNEVGCSDPEHCMKVCQSESGCTNIAFVLLVLDLLPTGMRGLMLAVMMAALMSSLTSVFNSASTIFTIDIWTRFRKKATDTEKLIVGRSFVIVLLGISIAWIPIITQYKEAQLFHYVQAVSNFLCPPITAIFLIGLFWKRMTEPGAFWGLMVGFFVGIVRFGLQFGYSSPACGSGLEDLRPEFVIKVVDRFHYLHFGAFSFLLVGVVSVVISLLTPPIPDDKLYRLTYQTRFSKEVRTELDMIDDRVETHQVQQTQQTTGEHPRSVIRKIFYRICGLEESTGVGIEPETTEEERAAAASDFLQEGPARQLITNIAAIVVMSMAAFIYGFFA